MALPSSAPAAQNPFAEQPSARAGESVATPSGQKNSCLVNYQTVCCFGVGRPFPPLRPALTRLLNLRLIPAATMQPVMILRCRSIMVLFFVVD